MNKKKYNKPEIFFEDFSLSTNITAGCELIPNFNEGECGIKWGKKHIFITGITGCTTTIENGDPQYDGACYHNPTDPNVFNS